MFNKLQNLGNKLIDNLIDINSNESANTIQVRSIAKIYSLMFWVHFIFIILLLSQGVYIMAFIEFLYLILLGILFIFNGKVSTGILANLLVVSTIIVTMSSVYTLGETSRYDLYLFLIIPLAIVYKHKNKTKHIFLLGTFLLILTCIAFYEFTFGEPIFALSDIAGCLFAIINSTVVFFVLYLYMLVNQKYNNFEIEKLKEDKKVLDKDSKMDHLTGLYNRRSMEKYLELAENQYHITNKPFGLILMDIDFFKKVNDTYGHQAGDKVLSEISRLIVYSLRKSDDVFRYGGEEILAVVTGVQSKEDLMKVAEEIREDVSSLKIPVDEMDISVTISLGVTLYDGQGIEKAIKKVDEALYMAKNNGRNRAEFL